MRTANAMKKCFKCGTTRSLGEFYRNAGMADGTFNKCKECTKQDVQKNRADKVEYYRAYDRARANTKVRKELRDRTSRRIRAEQPEKYAARTAVNNAIRDGRLVKGPCEVCGATKRVHAHHDDYSKPLDVRWLCPKHHAEAHGGHFIQKFAKGGLTRTCCGVRVSIVDRCPKCGGHGADA